MTFFEQLDARVRAVNSLVCVGLDPHLPDLPAPSPAEAGAFCRRLIDATAGVAAAFKPNAAFFELFGSEGWRVLTEVIAAAPPGIPVILDAKRGDIASTARAYARSAFETLGAGAITISPYLGGDSIAPFLENPDHAIFLLCKTSNPGAGDLQDLLLADSGRMVYEAVADMAQRWAKTGELGSSQIGLVAGATHPADLERIRRFAPDLWILAPGVGAQGGDLSAAIHAGLRSDGLGLLITVSRSLSQSPDPHRAAIELRDQINALREMSWRNRVDEPVKQSSSLPVSESITSHRRTVENGLLTSLADGLLDAGCVRFGRFTLKSGLVSPIYLDLRRLVGFPALMKQVAEAYTALLDGLSFDRIAALPYAALPIGTATALRGGWSLVYPRKEAKDYGTRAEIEGVYSSGEHVVVLDDLATTGGSKFEAIDKLESVGLEVTDVVVLIDRQSGAAEALAERGYRLHPLFTLTELLDYWESTGRVDHDQAALVRDFIAAGRT